MPDEGLTKEQLQELIKTTATEAIGPAITAALEPLTKAQGDVLDRIMRGMKPEPDGQSFDEKTLGKYPIGRKVRALAMAALSGDPGDPDAAIHAIKAAAGWPGSIAEPTIKWLEHVKTTLTAGTAATAGDMIMPQWDPEWIELLRATAVVRGIARTVPMPRGATSKRKQTASATAYYQGETDAMTQSNLTVGRANLSYKKLTALSVVSNDLIRFSAGEADRMVQEDLLRVVALREDRAFLFGNPTADAGSPQGVRYQTAAANINATTGVTLTTFQADLTAAVSLVESANIQVNPDECAWIMSPATFWAIFALATTAGDWVFAQGLSQSVPRLLGYRVIKTGQFNQALLGAWGYGTVGTAGQIFFVHAPSLEIHDSMQRTVEVFRGGAYYDAAAAAVASGISNDETVITCIAEHDFLQTYDQAAAIITGYAT